MFCSLLESNAAAQARPVGLLVAPGVL